MVKIPEHIVLTRGHVYLILNDCMGLVSDVSLDLDVAGSVQEKDRLYRHLQLIICLQIAEAKKTSV